MNVFITGASGIIGKKLLLRLEREGYQLSILVRKKENELVDNPSVKIFVGDILDTQILEAATKDIDAIIHLAGITHTNNFQLYYNINTQGTKNLIKACEKNRIKKFIYISSRAVGAEGGAYAHSKLLAEEEVKKSSIPWVILRPGEVYGAGEKEAVSRLIRIIQKNRFVPILGDGNYKLSPVYIDDVIEAVVASIDEKIINATYTICGPREVTYNELVDIILNYLHMKKIKICIPIFFLQCIAWIFYIMKKDVFVRDQIPRLLSQKSSDISAAARDLHFHPKSIEEGLRLLIKRNGGDLSNSLETP